MKFKLLVANTGEGSIGIIDLKNNYDTKLIPIKCLIKEKDKSNIYLDTYHIGPYGLCLSSNKGNIYLSNVYDNSIYKINISCKKIIDFIPVGKFPICLDVYNGSIFVLCSDSNSVSIIDESNFKLIENITVGEKPVDFEIDKLNKKIYIANNNGQSIDVIDINSNIISRIKLNKNPIKIQIEKDLMYVLSNVNNGVLNISNISIINVVNNSIIKSIDIEGIYNNMYKPHGIDFVYITSFESGCIFKIDLHSSKTILKKHLKGMPNKIAILGNNLYITNISQNCITIFNIKEDKMLKNIKVGIEPNDLIIIWKLIY